MAVRSINFAMGSFAAGGFHVVFTVPAEKTAIVKDVRFYNGAAATITAVWGVQRGSTNVDIRSRQMFAFTSAEDVQAFVVLEPGDSLYVFGSSGPLLYSLNGALLDGVA